MVEIFLKSTFKENHKNKRSLTQLQEVGLAKAKQYPKGKRKMWVLGEHHSVEKQGDQQRMSRLFVLSGSSQELNKNSATCGQIKSLDYGKAKTR